MKNVNIRDDMAQKSTRLAARHEMKPEVLINRVLDTYIANQSLGKERSGTAFLLSVAGMFDFGPNDTSERVQTIAAGSVSQKHRGSMHEGANR